MGKSASPAIRMKKFMENGFDKCGENGVYETTIDEMLIECGLYFRTQKYFKQRRFRSKSQKHK